jgi:hypothetical protein
VISWRVPVAALVMAACLSVIGYAIFPTPNTRQIQGTTIHIPNHRPSNAAWVWPDGVPGWEPGETIKGFPVANVQAVEVQAAALAAARHALDSNDVRVVNSTRPGYRGALAILATHTLYTTPERTCLAGLLLGDAPVQWVCPGPHSLSHKHVFVAAARLNWPGGENPIYFAGVARGDVTRIDLVGGVERRTTIYTRAKTWGEFDLAEAVHPGGRLLVYSGPRLVETVRLDLRVGQQRVLR